MDFALLGPLEVRDNGRTVAIARGKPRTVLALLLLADGRVVATERLIDALWESDPPATAATALQVYVSKLRKALGTDVIRTQPPGYAIDAPALDLRDFERLLHDARSAPADEAVRLLREALGLWRGDALCDAGLPGDAARLEELRLAALERCIEAELDLGRAADLVPELEQIVSREPLRESFRAQLMRALYGAGRQAEALAAYREARRVLVEELGLEPSERLRRVEQSILRGEPPPSSLSIQTTTATAAFIDLGVQGEVDELVPRAVDVATRALGSPLRVEPGLGDALVAVFATADEAIEGAAAAIASLREAFGDRVTPRAGLATADVTLDARVSGPAVVLAARRVRNAGPHDVAVGPRTAAAARTHVFEQRGDAHVLVS